MFRNDHFDRQAADVLDGPLPTALFERQRSQTRDEMQHLRIWPICKLDDGARKRVTTSLADVERNAP
jgi:hypothetical protein